MDYAITPLYFVYISLTKTIKKYIVFLFLDYNKDTNFEIYSERISLT